MPDPGQQPLSVPTSSNFLFPDFGIPLGSTIQFREAGIEATVISDRKILVDGIERFVTEATAIIRRRLNHRARSLGGNAHRWWSYNGVTLQQLWDRRFDRQPIETSASSRNPAWSREELILALDLYVRYGGNPPGKTSVEVLALSSLLNAISRSRGINDDFRNANGVYMKVMNFRRFDRTYIETGRVGLQRGGKDEAVVWEAFAHDPARLETAAEAIRATSNGELNSSPDELPTVPYDFCEAEEGRLLTVQHVRRERSVGLVKAKKKAVMEAGGRLACEACAFDYGANYGEHGAGYIECHHVQPLHTLKPGVRTTLADLALVCANCHRMIHAKAKWLTMDELRSLLKESLSTFPPSVSTS